MDFGKLPNVDHVNFALPPDADGTSRLLAQIAQENNPKQKMYIGPTGWSVKEWLGIVYPTTAKSKNYLSFYTQQFNTIELNTTHYHIPTLETIAEWRNQSTPDFKFCPKIPQSISHSRDLDISSGRQVNQFCEAIAGLGDNLGYSFVQLPPHFLPEYLPVLAQFLQIFPKNIPLAVEIRNERWFSEIAHFNRFFDLLEKNNVATVITDVSGRRDVLHQRLTADTVLIRFVGNALHATDYTRVDAWLQRIKTWFECGLKTVYFFTHEPDNLLAPQLADYVVTEFGKHCPTISTRGPNLNRYQKTQISLF